MQLFHHVFLCRSLAVLIKKRKSGITALALSWIVVAATAPLGDYSFAELIMTTTTSTTTGETHTRVDLPNEQLYSTRIIGYAVRPLPFAQEFVFDQTLPFAPSSFQVSAAFDSALAAVKSSSLVMNGKSVVYFSPRLVATSQSTTASVFLNSAESHTATSVTTSVSAGPGTILIGENQSITYFIPPGTVNTNTNTHTQHFIDDFYQATTTNFSTFEVVGQVVSLPGPGLLTSFLTLGARQTDQFLRNLFHRMDEDGDGAGIFALAQRGTQLALAGNKISFDGGLQLADEPGTMPTKFGAINVWVRGLGVWGDLKDRGDAVGYTHTTAGVAAGVDLRLTDQWLVGVSLGYSHSWVDASGDLGTGTVSTLHFGAYARWRAGPWFAKGAFTYGYSWLDTSRPFADLGTTSTADTTGSQIGVRAEAGYSLDILGIGVEPYAGIRYVRTHQGAFHEMGNGPLDVQTESASRNALYSVLGTRVVHRAELTPMWTLVTEGRLAWSQELLGERASITASIPGLSTQSFIVDGARPGRAGLLVGLTAGVRYGANFKAFVSYDGEFHTGYRAHALTGGVRLTW